jgi:DNA-directed RNA polymerase beta' subunit
MPAGIHRPDSDIQPVVGIQFGIFGPEEIEKRSVVEITNTGTYDGSEPRIGGLFDPRMGVLDNGKTCRSCGQTNHSCPGHFGHFKLARPVYFIQFFPYIMNVLNCVCVRCSKLLIDKELHKGFTKRRGEARWRAVLSKCGGISRCGQETEDGCGAVQPNRYLRDGIARITAEWVDTLKETGGEGKSKVTQVLEVEYVLRLFRRITDEDVDFMGLNRYFCRPDWMICSVLPIPPPQVRPSVIQDNNQRSEDDLTHKLFEIISTNQRLQDKINNNSAKNLIEDEHTVLQYHIATLVDNQIPGVAPSAQRSGRPLKSVQQRLGSKEGRIRYNIQGKRVEFSARSVITPDPNISVAEIGVPIKIAINLTMPEKVTPYNKAQMYKLIQNGPDVHPGAKTIVSANGSVKSLKHVNRREIVLHIGDVVNRHLDDGDIILFNRQPTLHRMSMMGHRVKVLPYNTFRLNVSVTAPYNADFDGDEMNAHIPQSYEASTELSEIAAVPHQIVTPRHAKPLIGVVQDALVGSYRITQPHVEFNRREFMNMMMWNKRFEGYMPQAGKKMDGKPPRWTGQQVLSQLMPPINLEMGNGLYKDNKSKDNMVKIREGNIQHGIFDKDIYSKPSKGIVHVTFRDYGPTATVNLIDSVQNTIEQFLVYNGFSVGISDLIADEETRKQMDDIVKKRKAAIEDILLQIHLDLFDNNTGKTNQQEFEDKVYTELNKATEEAGKLGLGALSDENRLVAMVRAGSKGSTINISQMMACVGQQAPEGRRIPYGFTDRTLPHFKKYDDGAEARGFVESSFIQGLTPQEFYFHAMSGREGLIDTAVKSVTGDTKIVVLEGGVTKCVAIGDWIDAHMSRRTDAVEHFEENRLELLQLDTDCIIPTVDSDGNVGWGSLVAVTRHDPGERLYKITTQAGKSVTVSEAQSLLIWDETTNKIEKKSLPDVQVGNCVPVTLNLPLPHSPKHGPELPRTMDAWAARSESSPGTSVELDAVSFEDAKHIKMLINREDSFTFNHDAVNMLRARVGMMPKEYKGLKKYNDVVLDVITNIEILDTSAHPKVYDVTVPGTFNFCLANGLHVRDTADTGYIQRQLVKAMEDLTAQYDGSVRDSRMNIVQFKYGEDGINATKIESASLGIGKLSDTEIRRDYGMEAVDAAVFAEGVQRGDDTEALKAFAEQVLADRTMLIEGIQHSKQEVGLFASVNIDRVLMNVVTSFQLDEKGTTDLTPLYVIQAIERLAQRTQSYHRLWAALLRFYLAPHKMILKHRLTRKAFDVACEMILVKNWQGWVQPGEQVGIIAAQSIGEPSTQMSASRHAFVNVCSAKGNHAGPIGDLIDKLLKQRADDVMEIGPDSVVLDLKENVYITGVSNDEKTSWKRISQVSRHPANGGLVKVTTKSGRSTTATLTHSFLKRTEKGVEPILGSELRVGMRVPIATKVEQVPQSLITQHSGFTLDKDFGWLCGIYLADGSFSGNTVKICKIHPVVESSIRTLGAKYGWPITVRNYEGEYGPSKETMIYSKELKDFLLTEFNTGSYEKVVGPVSYSAPREFQYGLIGGYFDGDGNVNAPRQQIRASSRSKELIRHMNRLLSYCGFFAVMSEETSIRIPDKTSYTLNILKRYAQQYKEQIGFRLEEKAIQLDAIISYMEREEKHDTKEMYDKIPAVGNQIALVGKALELPGQSRNYGRWAKKESIGRQTLQSYLPLFEAEAAKQQTAPNGLIKQTIAALKSAAYSDVIWDEITTLEYLDDPKEYVYDFTVPGNDSFMVDDCILVHNTLNTFHLAGVAAKSNVTRGVPRLKELLKVTQNPKAISLTVTLKPEIRDSKEKARKVAQDLELTLLKDITVKAAIYYDPDDSDSVLEEDRALVAFYKAFETENQPNTAGEERFGEGAEEAPAAEQPVWSKLMLRLELDRQRMFRKNISMDDIAFVLRQKFGEAISLVYSDYNTQRLIMRIRIPPSDLTASGENNGMDDMSALKKLQNRLLTGIVIRGVAGIKAAKFRQDKDSMEYNAEEGVYKQVTQYVLDTDGTNFLAVMNHPYVDGTKLVSSHVHDIYENLGIEATRATLIQEITTLFEEAGVNCRHLGLLCDVMTRQGRLMSVDRYGINKMDIGPIAKASFEETEKILLRAALFGEVDPVTGISANIMMGQPIHGGTGFFNILFDEGAFLRLQEGLPQVQCDEDDEAPEPTQAQINAELTEDQTDICSTARLRMNVAMPQKAVLMEEPDVEITIIGEE